MHMINRKQRKQQNGQILIIFAMMMGLLFVGIISFVADIAVMYTASTRTYAAALVASQSGANDISLAQIYQDPTNIQLNTDAITGAIHQCETEGETVTGTSGNIVCNIEGKAEVIATVKIKVNLPVPFFGTTATLSSTSTSCPVRGSNAALQVYC